MNIIGVQENGAAKLELCMEASKLQALAEDSSIASSALIGKVVRERLLGGRRESNYTPTSHGFQCGNESNPIISLWLKYKTINDIIEIDARLQSVHR